MGRVKFTNVDSAGDAVTRRLAVTIDGERHEIDIASTGTAQVSEAVEDYLVDSDDIAVEAYEPDREPEQSDED